MRRLWIVWIALLPSACQPEGLDVADGAPAPRRCDSGAWFSGEPSGSLRVGELEDSVFVSFDDDRMAEYTWGFQGGTMIQPVIGIPLDLAGDERCFEVTVRHDPDPGAPDAFGGVGAFPEMRVEVDGERDGDVVWLDPLLDQIGVDDLGGTRLTLGVVVRGTTFAASHQVAIEVVRPPPVVEPEACQALDRDPVSPGSCRYYEVPGTARVTARTDGVRSGTSNCMDAVELQVEFTPDDPAVEVCVTHELPVSGPLVLVTMRGWHDPPAACLADVSVGSEVRATLHSILDGTCSPAWIEIRRATCDTACLP